MAQPTSRSELKQYCLRQLGAPVLEINVAEEQCEDLIDDALQVWNERHYDGVTQVYYKHKITQAEIAGGREFAVQAHCRRIAGEAAVIMMACIICLKLGDRSARTIYRLRSG